MNALAPDYGATLAESLAAATVKRRLDTIALLFVDLERELQAVDINAVPLHQREGLGRAIRQFVRTGQEKAFALTILKLSSASEPLPSARAESGQPDKSNHGN